MLVDGNLIAGGALNARLRRCCNWPYHPRLVSKGIGMIIFAVF